MADQIIDRKTVGIPTDVDVVRNEIEIMKDDAEASETSARASAHAAQQSEEKAYNWASIAQTLVESQTGIHFADTEPPILARTNGMAWLVADMTNKVVTDLKRWDATQAGDAPFPDDDTWPGDALYPSPMGAWDVFTIDSSVISS